MNNLSKRINNYLKQRDDNHLFRKLTLSTDLIDFSSNDYLGFSRSAFIRQKVEQDLQRLSGLKFGSTGSRLLNGNTALHEELENKLAKFYHAEAALLFNSGFDANIGLIATIARKGDIIFYDELVHASIQQGMLLSGAHLVSFCHNDIEDLKAQLEQIGNHQARFLITESLFSMQGDIAPLHQLAQLAKDAELNFIVDEAHANGIFGSLGSGLCNRDEIEEICFARVFTFGKAIGSHGGVVVGSKVLKDYLINFSKPFIYSTALNLADLLSVEHAYFLLQNNINQQLKINNLILYFNKRIRQKKLSQFITGDGPVYGFYVKGNENCRQAAAYLQTNGFDIRPILSPTVPKGKERLRIILHSFNKTDEIAILTEKLLDIQNIIPNE
ncbi:MAG TPA: pyridoxal phosphate-dependent aminotransferase family protein [Chitinophagales bacterium]|nr:pyridoxal phosphate-dependent aminotransferase family protein [Chitinophagales bacterium]